MTYHLHLGDCLDFMRTLAANSVHCIVTDPPYGHNNNNGDLISRREAALGVGTYTPEIQDRPIANDGAEANDLYRSFLVEAERVLVPGGCCCCCCCGGGPDPQFARWSLWMDEVLEFKQMIVWDKGPMGMGWHYRRSYETVLVAQKKGAACKWYDNTNRVENIIRPGKFPKILPQADDHPTPKPVGLFSHFIQLHSLPGEIILDPFMGGGTAGVACQLLGRDFIGCEIDPKYFEVAKQRIEKATAQPQLFITQPAPQEEQKGLL